MGHATLGAKYCDAILDILIDSWKVYRGQTNAVQDVADALERSENGIEYVLLNAPEVTNYGIHLDLAKELIEVSLDFGNNRWWRAEFKCDRLASWELIDTKQEIRIDIHNPALVAAPSNPTAVAKPATKTYNVDPDPDADYDRAMKGLG